MTGKEALLIFALGSAIMFGIALLLAAVKDAISPKKDKSPEYPETWEKRLQEMKAQKDRQAPFMQDKWFPWATGNILDIKERLAKLEGDQK